MMRKNPHSSGEADPKAQPQRDEREVPVAHHRLSDEYAATVKPERISAPLASHMEERIALKMPSDLKYLDSVLDYLSQRMVKFGVIEHDDTEVLIALDEAIVNAVKHGNKGDPRKAVHIIAELNAEGARITVRDEGAGFLKDEIPDPTDPSRLLEPSGRGLLLINHIMDHVEHNDCGNQLQMFKRACNLNRQLESEE